MSLRAILLAHVAYKKHNQATLTVLREFSAGAVGKTADQVFSLLQKNLKDPVPIALYRGYVDTLSEHADIKKELLSPNNIRRQASTRKFDCFLVQRAQMQLFIYPNVYRYPLHYSPIVEQGCKQVLSGKPTNETSATRSTPPRSPETTALQQAQVFT